MFFVVLSAFALSISGCGVFDRSRRGDSAAAERRDGRIEEGRGLARQGQFAEAAEAFEDATYADPESAEAHFLLARALLELGRTYRALDELRAAERLRPDSGPQQILMGRVLVRLGRLDDAEEVLENALQSWPEDPRAHYALGVLRLRQDRLTDAELSLTRAVRSAPRLPGLQEVLGRALLRLGRADQAIVCFEQAIEQRECDDLAHGGLAVALVMTSQPGQGQAEFQRAIACADGEQASPWYAGLALAFAAEARYRDALENLERGARLFRPPVLRALQWRMRALDAGGEGVDCQAHVATCGRADEQLWSGALLLFVVGAPDAAERELGGSISTYDGDSTAHWIMAEALHELGREEEVELELNRAITWEPSDAVGTAIRDLRRRLADH